MDPFQSVPGQVPQPVVPLRDPAQIPSLDEGPEIDGSTAFSFSRAARTAWQGVKVAPLAMWLAGAIMLFVDQGSQLRLPNMRDFSGPQDDRETPDFSSDLLRDVSLVVDPERWAGLGLPLHGVAHAQPAVGAGEAIVAGVVLGILLVVLLVFVALFLARAWFVPGYLRFMHHVLQTGEQRFPPMFSGADRFVHQLLYQLAYVGIVVVIFAPLTVAFGLVAFVWRGMGSSLPLSTGLAVLGVVNMIAFTYVALGLTLSDLVLTLENRGPLESMRRSWRLMRGQRLSVLWFLILSWLTMLGTVVVGFLACCIGLLVFVPIARAALDLARVECFLLFTRGHAVTPHWRLSQLVAQSPG